MAEQSARLTNRFLDAWSTLVEAVRNGDMKHVSKFCHVNPTISSKVMVIGVLLAYLRTADNGRKPPTKTAKTYGNVY